MKISQLNVRYGQHEALCNVTFDLRKGEPMAILGESGAGKTTFGKALLGMASGTACGSLAVDGMKYDFMRLAKAKRYRGRVCAMLPQEVDDAFNPYLPLGRQLLEAAGKINTGNLPDAAKMLAKVGLSADLANAYPRHLSGGQLKRALLASILINDPTCLILDEPTAALDGESRDDFLKLVHKLRENRYLIIITHDREVALNSCTWTSILYGGHLVETGKTEDVLTTPRHPYGRGLLRAAITPDRAKDLQGIPGRARKMESGCPFYGRCTQRLALCAHTPPALAGNEEHRIACHRGGILTVLEGKQLFIARRNRKLFHSLNFHLQEGETLALTGPSGCGKTSLTLALLGLLPLKAGQLFFDGRPVNSLAGSGMDSLSHLAQHPRGAIAPHFTVRETVEEPLRIQGDRRTEDRVIEVLENVQLNPTPELLQTKAHSLSGGELQRVALARALIRAPRILILDEPTSALDVSTQAKILRLLLDLQEKNGMAMLLITHDLLMAGKVADRIMDLGSHAADSLPVRGQSHTARQSVY